jgi:hypothetical protein
MTRFDETVRIFVVIPARRPSACTPLARDGRLSSHLRCCCCSTQRAQPPALALLLLFNTTRTRSGPPSTRATITMDGGVADTARANTKNSCEHKPLIGKSWGKRERRTSICASPVPPFPRMYRRGTNRTAVRSGHSCRSTHARAPRRRKPREPDPHSPLVPYPRGARVACAAAAPQHNAHTLRTPKHESHYRYGRRCGRHSCDRPRPL